MPSALRYNYCVVFDTNSPFLLNVNKIPRTPHQENNMTYFTTMPRSTQQYFLDNNVS